VIVKEHKTVAPGNSLAFLEISNLCFCRVLSFLFIQGYCKVSLNLTLYVVSCI